MYILFYFIVVCLQYAFYTELRDDNDTSSSMASWPSCNPKCTRHACTGTFALEGTLLVCLVECNVDLSPHTAKYVYVYLYVYLCVFAAYLGTAQLLCVLYS